MRKIIALLYFPLIVSVSAQEIFYFGMGMKTFPVWLKKGQNTILVKALNLYDGWNFVLKMTDVDHTLTF